MFGSQIRAALAKADSVDETNFLENEEFMKSLKLKPQTGDDGDSITRFLSKSDPAFVFDKK